MTILSILYSPDVYSTDLRDILEGNAFSRLGLDHRRACKLFQGEEVDACSKLWH
ncbi:hypothetical protein HY2_15390 [Hyphomonas pacifica]|nr:hypothetical protein HY2_15390 [Hyphomonas pacifica]